MSKTSFERRAFLKYAGGIAAGVAALRTTPIDLLAQSPTSPAAPAAPRAVGPRKFSLAHLTVMGLSPAEMTYVAARAGYDYVSFRLISLKLPNEPNWELAFNKELLQQTKTALKTTGLKVLDIEVARIGDGLDPKKFLPAMETAAELGARYVLANEWATDRRFTVDCFGQICDMAKPLGLTVVYEFVTFATGKSLADAVSVLRAANRPNAGILVDMLHFSRSRVALAELDTLPREWFPYIHLCDAPAEIPTTNDGLIQTARQERLYPGEGGIDIASILNHLPESPCSLEIPHLARVKELGYTEHAFRCLEHAKRYVHAHPRGRI